MAKRVAILGGGISSLFTAFELSKLRDGDRPAFDITVYQMGWRLGGKGASGRNPASGDRIEEHGLHVLFGAYENAFRILREVYDGDFEAAVAARNATRAPGTPAVRPLARSEAFHGQNFIAMYERPGTLGATSAPWIVDAPERSGEPGDGTRTELGPANILRLILAWTHDWIERAMATPDASRLLAVPAGFLRGLAYAEDIGRTEGNLPSPFPLPYVVLLERLLDSANTFGPLRAWLEHGRVSGRGLWFLRRLLHATAALAQRVLRLIRSGTTGTTFRRNRIGVDFALTVLIGFLRDGVLGARTDWFAIDDWDLRAWLRRHGAEPATVDSALVDGLYMAAFSARHPLGAGTILHALVRGAHYKGHVFYRMQGGMGDVIFVPLYLALKHRGVRFRFFQRVRSIEADAAGDSVARVWIEDQAPNTPDYDPLIEVDVHGRRLLCWPTAPIADRLHPLDRESLRNHDPENWWDRPDRTAPVELRARSAGDVPESGPAVFDALVLGIGIGAHADICGSLMKRNARFGTMVNSIVTTPTQAAQLWLAKTRGQLGWTYPGYAGRQPMVIPFTGTFDTCADMSHLIRWERIAGVEALVYVCTSLPDIAAPPPGRHAGYPELLRQTVRKNLEDWLMARAGDLWPRMHDPPGFLASCVPSGIDGQHWIAVMNPSDRYVLAVPGSNRWRLRAGASGFHNLVLAGDWTKTGLSVGCVEAATMSAIDAARAVMTRLGVARAVRDRLVPRARFDWLPEEP